MSLIEDFSLAVRDIYQLAVTSPLVSFREEALNTMSKILPFDSAMWGLALGGEVIPFNIHLHHQPPEMLTSWQKVQHLDPLVPELRRIEPGTTVYFCDLIPHEEFIKHPLYLDHARHFDKEYTMSTRHLDELTGTNSFISIYRHDADQPFTTDEQQLKQMLFPHLIEAHRMYVREQLYLKGNNTQPHGNSSSAVCDRDGVLHYCDDNFLSLMGSQWQDTDSKTLPSEVIGLIEPDATSKELVGSQVACQTHALGKLFHISIRRTGPLDHLPQRQRSIAELLANGLTYKEIARHLDISPSTVTNHINTLYERLGVRNKAEVTKLVVQRPVISQSASRAS